jgi:hypothetical protein
LSPNQGLQHVLLSSFQYQSKARGNASSCNPGGVAAVHTQRTHRASWFGLRTNGRIKWANHISPETVLVGVRVTIGTIVSSYRVTLRKQPPPRPIPVDRPDVAHTSTHNCASSLGRQTAQT